MEFQMWRLPRVIEARGKGRESTYNDVRRGLLTPPVAIGARAKAWPSHEVEAINSARLAGKSDDEIRALVARLIAARREAA